MSTFLSLTEAADNVGVDKKTISKACLGEIKNCAGYYWSYSLSTNFKREADKRSKKVFQFSIEGRFITQFCSVAEAARKTGVNASSIAKCCRGEYALAGDFRWEYSL